MILFCCPKKIVSLLFFLYPLSRVLKFPSFETSILTILLVVFFLRILIDIIINKHKYSFNDLIIVLVFSFYLIFTLVISLINYKGFTIQSLLSYYIYLFFPFGCFVFLPKKEPCFNLNKAMILTFISYLFGILVTIFFYYVIPNGKELLKNAGVNVFEMGKAGIRFSPLTDDPNYGTAYIALLGSLFICCKKDKKEMIIGYIILSLCFALSCLSVSKMFLLCLAAIIVCIVIKICVRYKNSLVTSLTIVSVFCAFLLFFVTPLGQNLITRTIGSGYSFSLDMITTGRFSIFGMYTEYILEHPLTVIFGKGPLFYDKALFYTGDHNTFSKSVFGSGIIGVTLILLLLFLISKSRNDCVKKFPLDPLFFGFLICCFVCFMSLCITPATVFPFMVTAAHYSDFSCIANKKMFTFKEEIEI